MLGELDRSKRGGILGPVAETILRQTACVAAAREWSARFVGRLDGGGEIEEGFFGFASRRKIVKA